MSTTIEIRRLSKHYKSFSQGLTKAVDDVSLTIPAGSLFFLLGPSGCGKTTLLRMIAGFIEPTSGGIYFNGRDVSNVPPSRRNTGMVFQSYALWPHMTVVDNVAFGLSVRKVPARDRSERAMEALRSVRMEQYAARKPNQLSGGQQQRVALARALVIRPDVFLLDEPLSNLDAKLRLEMRHEIQRICKESGLTTVYVTHDQKEALSMADGVAVLSAGRVVQVGPPRQLYSRPRSRFVADFLGETNFLDATVADVAASATAQGQVRVRTGAGELVSAAADAAKLSRGASVVCSLRPEALRLVEPRTPGALPGSIVESTFLGETMQHVVQLAGGLRLRVSQIHPGVSPPPLGPVGVMVEPADVVLLSE